MAGFLDDRFGLGPPTAEQLLSLADEARAARKTKRRAPAIAEADEMASLRGVEPFVGEIVEGRSMASLFPEPERELPAMAGPRRWPETAETAATPAKRLLNFVERIEALLDERAEINGFIAEVRKQAKGEGFNVEALNAVVARRAKPEKDWDGLDAAIAIYVEACGSGGAGLDPLLDMARATALISPARDDATVTARKGSTAKDRQLAEALAWVRGPAN